MSTGDSDRPAAADTDAQPDSLRAAVERTLAATAGSASETRDRARGLLDEVARRGEEAREELARRGEEAREGLEKRGEAAREEVVRRREAAREDLVRRGEEATSRLSEAISDLNLADRDDLGPIADRIAAVETRLGDLERSLRRERLDRADGRGRSNPQPESETNPRKADSGG